MSEEAQLLLDTLSQSRAHVLGILEGLSVDQLRRPIQRSGWTCLGLVNHLAIDVERFWFRAVMANEPGVWDGFAEEAPNPWEVDSTVDADQILLRYQQEVRAADRILAVTPLDTPPAAWPDALFGEFRMNSLRAVVLHVITETACHAGHLDAARETIDGRQWMVL